MYKELDLEKIFCTKAKFCGRVVGSSFYVPIPSYDTPCKNRVIRSAEEFGLEKVDEVDNGNNIHIYLSPKENEKINYSMEIIKGQDHCYWIYDNDRDSYYKTDVSWNTMDEETFFEKFNRIGFTLYGSNWVKELDI